MGSQHHLTCLFCEGTPFVNMDPLTERVTVDCPLCMASFEREEYLRLLKEGIE